METVEGKTEDNQGYKGGRGGTTRYLGTGGREEEFPLLTQTIGEEVARGISRSRKCTRHSG